MKILQVIDSPTWAINQLAKVIEKKNLHLNIKTIAIHPKDLRNNPQIWSDSFKNEVDTFKPDIVHFHYWDLANTLAPFCGEAKVILSHHNQKNLLTHKWEGIDHIVVATRKAKKILNDNGYENVSIAQYGIDIERFKFNEDYDSNNRTIGYVGRIVPWKGLYEIAKAAKELGTKVICMGKIDKSDYWEKLQEYKDVLDIRFNTPTEKQPEVYHEMGVYVGNSVDNIEEGTLGFLEAMSCGIPVVTTPAGLAADIVKDGEHVLITDYENYDSLISRLRTFFEMDAKKKNEMREKAWDAVRILNTDRFARLYELIYYKLAYEKDLVSVVIPTFNRSETLVKMLEAYKAQTYKPIEIIVCDDNSTDETRSVVFNFASQNRNIPVKYINTYYEGYGLAMARNMGIFEASGYYMVFNDDRMCPEPEAVEKLIKRLSSVKEKVAVYGDKGSGKRSFIENFFAIRKKHIVKAGMFNERINLYGGQSQEIRERLLSQEFDLQYEPEAKAKPLFGTRRSKRRYDLVKSKIALWKLDR